MQSNTPRDEPSLSCGMNRRSALLAGSAAMLAWSGAARAAEPQRVRIVSALPTISLVVANQTSLPKQLGYFEEEGVRTDFALAAAGGTTGAAQLVATGDQDIGSGSMSPLITRAAQGEDMGLVFFYNQVREFHASVATTAESGIKSIADLRGKPVGIPTLAGEGSLIARYVAREAGVDPNALRFVAVGVGAQALHALRTNQVAALLMNSGSFAQMETLGANFVYLPMPASAKALFGPGLFAKRDYVQKNRKAVVGIGRAVAKSTLFLITNPEAAVRIHWKEYPQQVPQGVPMDKALRDAVHVLKTQANGLALPESDRSQQWGQYPAGSWSRFVDYLNLSDKVKDTSRFYTNDLIAEINSFDAQKVIAQAKNFRIT